MTFSDAFEDIGRVIAHEAGHAVAAWASPVLPPPVAIRFHPLEGEAGVEMGGWPDPRLPGVHLEFAALYLAGFAGETAVCGDFDRLLKADFQSALEIARLVRRIGRLPKRRRGMTAFRSRLPHGLHAGVKTFLDLAFDLAVARITTHQDVHARLCGMLARGYHVERRVEFLSAELATWLGPRPSAA